MTGKLFLILASLMVGTPCLAQSKLLTLRPSKNYWDHAKPAKLHIAQLSQSRKLASVGDSLYMLNRRNRIVWQWTSGGAPLTDVPVMDSTQTIYVIGYDLVWVAIDANTGHEKWKREGNGSGLYSQIKPYRKDMYIVVTNLAGYRERLNDRTIKDYLSICRGNDLMWETNIPANSRISVLGNRVFAAFRRRNRIVRWALTIPDHLRPIGPVSGWYPHP